MDAYKLEFRRWIVDNFVDRILRLISELSIGVYYVYFQF